MVAFGISRPERWGGVRAELLSYAVITLVLIVGIVFLLQTFALPEQQEVGSSLPPPPPVTTATTPRPTYTAPRRQPPLLLPTLPHAERPKAPREYAQDLARDRQLLMGVWLKPAEVSREGRSPGIRLRFTTEHLAITFLPENRPPSEATFFYALVEEGGVRYLHLIREAFPLPEQTFTTYRLEGDSLTLEGERFGSLVGGKIQREALAGTDLLGVWKRQEK
jgi:hypothetical protein